MEMIDRAFYWVENSGELEVAQFLKGKDGEGDFFYSPGIEEEIPFEDLPVIAGPIPPPTGGTPSQ